MKRIVVRNVVQVVGLGALVAGLAVVVARAGDQPQWGQRYTRNMVSAEVGLPEDFDPASGRNVKWAAELGTDKVSFSQAGPAVRLEFPTKMSTRLRRC